tara:strand:- start:1170 stop:1391 length:222 start_codon:yes stop_codon:yes gene_type:complete
MTNEQIVRSLRDVILKQEGAINILIDGKPIPAYQRLNGVKDALLAIRTKIIQEDAELHEKLEKENESRMNSRP